MPTPTLVATPGSASANSYCTVAEANAYHDSHGFATTWTSASTADKTVALIWATRLLDATYNWVASVVDGVQALKWPRWAVMDAHDYDYIPTTTIPQELKNATAELARQLLVSDRTIEGSVDANNLKRIKAGSVELEFKTQGSTLKPIPDAVSTLIPRWWYESMNVASSFTRGLLRA